MANVKSMPDRLFVMLRENFNVRGKVGKDIREFEKPSFRPGKVGKLDFKSTSRYKRHRLKKSFTGMHPKVQKQIRVI